MTQGAPGTASFFSSLLGHGPVVRADELTGGVINRVQRLHAADGFSAVLKTCNKAPPGLYRCEAASLDALRGGALAIPDVYFFSDTALLIEDFGPQDAALDAAPPVFWEQYGRAFAQIHGRLGSRFGFAHDTWWGLMRMDNRWNVDGHDFYAEQRFRWFLRRPVLRSRLSASDLQGIDAVAARLREHLPPQKPCLNHGDLWSGNRAITHDGRPGAIDPFVHYGFVECDLHNCRMFGGFPRRFFDAYRESRPLDPGWERRTEIFDILHLLGMIEQLGCEGWELPWLRRLLTRFG
jgi:fructosamine-3-kinase